MKRLFHAIAHIFKKNKVAIVTWNGDEHAYIAIKCLGCGKVNNVVEFPYGEIMKLKT